MDDSDDPTLAYFHAGWENGDVMVGAHVAHSRRNDAPLDSHNDSEDPPVDGMQVEQVVGVVWNDWPWCQG